MISQVNPEHLRSKNSTVLYNLNQMLHFFSSDFCNTERNCVLVNMLPSFENMLCSYEIRLLQADYKKLHKIGAQMTISVK